MQRMILTRYESENGMRANGKHKCKHQQMYSNEYSENIEMVLMTIRNRFSIVLAICLVLKTD